MQIEYGKIDGDIEIASDFEMHGMFTGAVTVKDGGFLVLHGTAKTIIVENGSTVEIPGMVTGNVINLGGYLKVSGMICGALIRQAGQTDILAKASIKNLS